MRYVTLFLLLVSSFGAAQQKKAAAKPSPLAECRNFQQITDSALVAAQAERDKLKADNADLEARFDKLIVTGKEVVRQEELLLVLANGLVDRVEKLEKDKASLVDDYNRLIEIAQRQAALNAVVTHQQQPVFIALPRYTPAPPQTINLRVSDCTKYPALCIN